MTTTIFCYTGTGNSLWVARLIASKLGDTEVISISEHSDKKIIRPEVVGLVFPVHIWGVPAPVIRFVKTLKGLQPSYMFAIAVHAGQVSNTLIQLKRIMAENNLDLATGFQIAMPSNYIPWGGPGPLEKQNRCFDLAREKIASITVKIQQKANLPVEKGPLWQRLLFTAIYNTSFSHVPKMDKKFWVDDKCNACEICYRVCPAGNITMREGKPVWNHRCEQCFTCLQWCPQEAIQYGKRTPEYERYHHPEISLQDILKSR